MKYRLKAGETLRPFGPDSCIDGKNLTDEIAEFHLAKHPEDIEKFQEFPKPAEPKAAEPKAKAK